MHSVRDNLQIDLREDAPDYFKALPTDHLVSHYPAPYPAAENEYRVPVYVRDGEPDLTDATLSRAAELALVAYDSNAAENQFLQGWLDAGSFPDARRLWALLMNFCGPTPTSRSELFSDAAGVLHNLLTGHVFARTSWDEDAIWLGYFDGQLQTFRDGKIETLKAGAATEPVHVGEAIILSAQDKESTRFRADAEAVFVLNLAPHAIVTTWRSTTKSCAKRKPDIGGTPVLPLPEGIATGIRVKRRAE